MDLNSNQGARLVKAPSTKGCSKECTADQLKQVLAILVWGFTAYG